MLLKYSLFWLHLFIDVVLLPTWLHLLDMKFSILVLVVMAVFTGHFTNSLVNKPFRTYTELSNLRSFVPHDSGKLQYHIKFIENYIISNGFFNRKNTFPSKFPP